MGNLFWDGRALRNEVLHIYNFLPFFVQHFTSIIILTPPPSEGLGEAFHLSIFIHFLVILLIVATCYVIEPFLVVQIPTDGLLDAFLKLE